MKKETGCDCIKKINVQLAQKGQELEQHPTINFDTGESSMALALTTVPIIRGAKKGKLFLQFCPFCGVKS
jgi:hypothetical protein